jgi:hypothetical protein
VPLNASPHFSINTWRLRCTAKISKAQIAAGALVMKDARGRLIPDNKPEPAQRHAEINVRRSRRDTGSLRGSPRRPKRRRGLGVKTCRNSPPHADGRKRSATGASPIQGGEDQGVTPQGSSLRPAGRPSG